MGYLEKSYMISLYKLPLILLVTIFIIFQHFLFAIPLRLKNGNPLEGKLISVEGNRINFESNGMILTLPIERIIAPDTEWFDQAESLLNQGDYSNAYEYCRQLLIWDPDHIKAMELRKLILQKQDEEKKETARIAEEKKREEELKILEKEEKVKQDELEKQKLEEEKNKPYEILAQTSETYKKITTSVFDCLIAMEITAPGTQQKVDIPVRISTVKPDKVRLEVKGDLMQLEIISDGNWLWLYMPTNKTYSRKSAARLSSSIAADNPQIESILGGFSQFEHIHEKVKNAKILREESITIDNKSMDCYVIRLESEEVSKNPLLEEGPSFFWIDKKSHLVLKFTEGGVMKSDKIQMGMKNTFFIKSYKINESFPADYFQFKVPEGVKETAFGKF